jgi:hypothetical protein
MGKNCNGFKNKIRGNEKIAKALDIKDNLGIDCLMYCKHQINFHHKDNKNNLKQMFQQELVCTAISAHNVHEDKHAGRVQEGGTGTICFGKCTGYIKKVGWDETGLGRWSWILMGGANGFNTRIIMAYNPCKNKNANSGPRYQQQRHYYITKRKDLTCSLILFRRNLVKQLQKLRAAEDKFILFMDHNKHAIEGNLGKALVDRDGLDMRETILQHTGKSPGAMFFRGSKPIDGLWVSSNIDISNACVMPFGYGVGDHHAFILDIPIESLVGINPVKIVRPASRQINSRLPGCSEAYIDSLEGNITRHWLLKLLCDAHTGGYSAEETAQRVIIIDKKGKACMRQAEKICRKIKFCRIPFSPEALIWIQ